MTAVDSATGGVLGRDLGHRSGLPPTRPAVSPEARAVGAALYELDRRERITGEVSDLCAVLIGASDSLRAGQRPEAVVHRLRRHLDTWWKRGTR